MNTQPKMISARGNWQNILKSNTIKELYPYVIFCNDRKTIVKIQVKIDGPGTVGRFLYEGLPRGVKSYLTKREPQQ